MARQPYFKFYIYIYTNTSTHNKGAMTGSMKHDLFRGSSAGGSCGLVMVVVPAFVFIFASTLSLNAWHGVPLLATQWFKLSLHYLYNPSTVRRRMRKQQHHHRTTTTHTSSFDQSSAPSGPPFFEPVFCSLPKSNSLVHILRITRSSVRPPSGSDSGIQEREL